MQTYLKGIIKNKSFAESLAILANSVNEKIVFSTSFSIEDQAITHAILVQKIKNIEIFTLDTGRLFEETYSVCQQTNERYKTYIKSYYPENQTLENFINTNGINSFYDSVELRKQCCAIRKVEPLKRAIEGTKIWITGLRAEHSPNRNSLEIRHC
jgi:phosphoadenosine phosphosulfate reductase